MKKIAVDLDGVVSNFETKLILERLNEKYNKRVSLDMIDDYWFEPHFSKPQLKEMIKELGDSGIYRRLKPISNSFHYLKKLINKDYDIRFVTARNEKYRNDTSHWLKKHGIYNSKLIMRDDKEEVVTNDYIAFIDDSADNIKQVFKKNRTTKMILFDYYYNKWYNNNSVKRVKNWKEVYECVVNEI